MVKNQSELNVLKGFPKIRRFGGLIIIIIIIITAYTAAFPQSGSSSAGIISASDIGQATSTGEIPLLFSRSAVGSLKSLVLG